jgi:hypothetical protein
MPGVNVLKGTEQSFFQRSHWFLNGADVDDLDQTFGRKWPDFLE